LGGARSEEVSSDLRALVLPLLEASGPERKAHDELLRELDKACKQGAVWRPNELPSAVA
jgi:hypothetical protein